MVRQSLAEAAILDWPEKLMATKTRHPIDTLDPEEATDPEVVNAVIETAQGCRNKFEYDEVTGHFKLTKVLPAGSQFPYSFGFVPKTLAEDGDPVDILVLADEPIPTGCIVPTRLIGVLEAEQSEDGKVERNDRLIGVASASHDYSDLRTFKNVSRHLLEEIEHFFVLYHKIDGKKVRILACKGPGAATKVLKAGLTRARRHRERKS